MFSKATHKFKIRKIEKNIDNILFDADLVILGIKEEIPDHDINFHLDKLISFATKSSSHIKASIRTLEKYYLISQILSISFKEWYQSGGEETDLFERMDRICCSFIGTCEYEIENILKTYVPDQFVQTEYTNSIQPLLMKSMENEGQILTVKPSLYGISVDLKKLISRLMK